MSDKYNDIGACPVCDSKAWKYTEIEVWNGRKCKVCEGIFIHPDVGLKSEGYR